MGARVCVCVRERFKVPYHTVYTHKHTHVLVMLRREGVASAARSSMTLRFITQLGRFDPCVTAWAGEGAREVRKRKMWGGSSSTSKTDWGNTEDKAHDETSSEIFRWKSEKSLIVIQVLPSFSGMAGPAVRCSVGVWWVPAPPWSLILLSVSLPSSHLLLVIEEWKVLSTVGVLWWIGATAQSLC